jgi:hypothetical protein
MKQELFRYMDDVSLGDNIEEEARDHSRKYMRYAEQYSIYVKNFHIIKNEIDKFKADLYLSLKNKYAISGEKVTETNISSQITAHPDLTKLLIKKNELRHSMILFKEILKSLKAKEKSISLLLKSN